MPTTRQRFGLGQVFRDASAEARRRGDHRVGTEHVALALLLDPESITARALDVDLDWAREALAALDRDALASVGIEVPGTDLGTPVPARRRLRLTPGALAVFAGLGARAKGERLGVQHVLLALLDRQPPDPAAVLLDALGVDRGEVRRRLATL